MSYGVKIGCRILYGQFNQDVIWESDAWHVWVEFKGTKNCSTHHVHIDGAYNWLHLRQMLLKGNHRQFVVATYEVSCDLHDLKKMTCFELVDFT
jgi:hypothetical protein